MTALPLSSLEKELIPRMQLDAKRAPSELARELRVKERSVRYALHRLQTRAVIQKAPFFNLYPLGLQFVNLYFSASTNRAAAFEQFLALLLGAPRVVWLAELGAEYQYGMSLVVQELEEIPAFLDQVSKRFPDIFFEKSYVFHLSLRIYPSKFLAGKKFAFPALRYGSLKTRYAADDLDSRIVTVMGEQLLTSGRAVARALGAPHSTIELRIRRLESAGIIAGYWYLFDVTRLGYQTLKVIIHAKGHYHLLGEALERFARNHPNVSYFIECLGAWDFELGMDVEHPSRVSVICRELLSEFGAHINNIRVVPMFRVLKWRPVSLPKKAPAQA